MYSHGVAAPAEGPYTWDDFVRLGDDDRRELIDGELVEVEVPGELHEHVVATLIFHLVAWTRGGPGGRVLASGYKIRISTKRGVMPDVQFYAKGNLAGVDQQDGLTHGRPDLVVEVASPSNRRFDRVSKLAWYASRGVPEYWVVDPEERTVERMVLDGEHYVIADALCEEDAFRPASFPGLTIALGELWARPSG